VSRDCYSRLEQSIDSNPSAAVLAAIARVLRLNPDEIAHLHHLAGITIRPARRTTKRETVSPRIALLLSQWTDQPAVVIGRYRDVLAANELASVVNPAYQVGVNLLDHVFLDPTARELYPDWDDVARGAVAGLRAGGQIGDARLVAMVGRLSLASHEFSELWARHNVLERAEGTKRFHHRSVGTLELDYQVFQVVGTEHQTLYVFPLTSAQRDTIELLLIPSDATSTRRTDDWIEESTIDAPTESDSDAPGV
jgi:hypothetical protein